MEDISITTNLHSLVATITGKAAGMDEAASTLKKNVAQKIIDALPGNMNWRSGNGTLASSFFFDGNFVTSTVPYARRRELSFHGPDSRGRMFPHDPAAFYMRDTLQQITSGGSIEEEFTTAMSGLWGGK